MNGSGGDRDDNGDCDRDGDDRGSELVGIVDAREPVLDAVAGDSEPIRKRRIVEETGASRSTVDRAIRELAAHDLVARRDGGWAPTVTGRLLLEEYRAVRRRASEVGRASDVLAPLSPTAPIDTAALVGAEVVRSDRTAPNRPTERHLEHVRSAEHVRALVTALSSQYVDTYRRCVVDCAIELDAVCPPDIVERLVGTYPDALAAMLDTGRLELREASTVTPFDLVVLDGGTTDRIGIVIYGPDGSRGYVTNDDPAAVAWGEELFAHHRTSAEAVTPPER